MVATGRVERVEPVAFTDVTALGVEEQRAHVVVAFEASALREGALELGDGYRVTVQFVLRETAEAVRVPESALFRDGDGWGAFVVADGRARRRRVAVGYRDGLQAEVLSGLSPGDPVVVHPPNDLEDGTRVEG